VFNPEKLDWFNQQHIARIAPDELAARIKPTLEAAGLWRDGFTGDRHAWFIAVLELLRPRVRRLDDFAAQGRFFFTGAEPIEYDEAAVDKHLRVDGVADHLAALDVAFASCATFDPASVETALRHTAEVRGVKAASLIHAVRVALTGKTVSPGIFDVVSLLGREVVHSRLIRASRQFATPGS